jgi:hypothetical protein
VTQWGPTLSLALPPNFASTTCPLKNSVTSTSSTTTTTPPGSSSTSAPTCRNLEVKHREVARDAGGCGRFRQRHPSLLEAGGKGLGCNWGMFRGLGFRMCTCSMQYRMRICAGVLLYMLKVLHFFTAQRAKPPPTSMRRPPACCPPASAPWSRASTPA